MTEEELRAIEARCEAATPGPWWVAEPIAGSEDRFIAYGTPGDRSDEYDLIEAYQVDDYEFIASARSDVPALIADVRRLREENEALRGAVPVDTAAAILRDWSDKEAPVG